MDLKNRLGLEGIAFQQEEERISKQKAKKLFEDYYWTRLMLGHMQVCRRFTVGFLKMFMNLRGKPGH